MKLRILFLLTFMALNTKVNATVFYWKPGANNNAGDFNNWHPGSCTATPTVLPGVNDSIQFKSCSGSILPCTFDVDFTVAQIEIKSNYTSVITMLPDAHLTFNTGKFNGGTFIGNVSDITSNTTMTIDGCNFTSASGTLTCKGTFNFKSGAFNHNNGTVLFVKGTGSSATIKGNSSANILTINFYNLEFTSTTGSSTTFKISYLTLVVNNQLKFSGGKKLIINNTSTSGITILGNLLAINSSSSSGGTILLTFSGTGKQRIEDTQAGTVYSHLPSIKINKPSDTLSLIGEFGIASGKSWEYVKGIINAGTSKVYCFDQNSLINSSPASMNFYDLEFQGNNHTITNKITVLHTLFTSGSTDCKINAAVLGGTLEMNGDLQWNNTASVNFGNVSWLFSGTNSQIFTASVTPIFFNLEINKTDKYVQLKKALSISHQLTMNNGFIVSDSINTVTILNGASIINASPVSFVRGSIKKIGNTAFLFPIGVGWKYRPVEISAPATTADIFIATYYSSAQNSGTAKDASLTYLSNCEYWNLNHAAGTSSVTVKLYWDILTCNIDTLPTLKIARFNSSTLLWNNAGNVTTTGDVINGSVVTNAVQSQFGNFVIAKASALPIINAGANITTCEGTRILLGGNPTATGGAPPYTYSWSPNTGLDSTTKANTFATVYSTTDYIVTVIDKDDAKVSDTIHVIVNSAPKVNAGTDRAIAIGSTTQLGSSATVIGGTPPYTYLWEPSFYLNQATIEKPTAGPVSNIAYSLTATDAFGCKGNDIVNVLLKFPSSGKAGLFSLLAGDSLISLNSISVASKVGSRKYISGNIHSTDTITIQSRFDSLAIVALDSFITKIKALNSTAISSELGGNTLNAGSYSVATKTTLNGNLTLSGNPNSVFIFNLKDSFVVGSGAQIILAGISRSQVLFRVGKSLIVKGSAVLPVTFVVEKNITGGTILGSTLLCKQKIKIDGGTFSPEAFEARLSASIRTDASTFLGINSQNNTKGDDQYPSLISSNNYKTHLPLMNATVFRYPPGGLINKWNTNDGWFIDVNNIYNENDVSFSSSLSCLPLSPNKSSDVTKLPNSRLLEAKSLVTGNNMQLLLPLNIYENISFQKDIIQHALDLKLNIPFVELGEEFYLKEETCGFPQPEDYAAKVNEYLNMIHSTPEFNGIKVGIVASAFTTKDDVTDNIGCRRITWNAGMLPHLTGYKPHDALTFHIYPDCGIDTSKRPNIFPQDIPSIMKKAFLAVDTFANNELKILNSYPDFDAWITEYNLNDKLFKVHGSWAQSLYVSILTLRMLEYDKIKFVNYQTMVNDATRGLFFSSALGFKLFPDYESIDSTLHTQPWGLSASGLSIKMIGDAMRYCTKATLIDFSEAPKFAGSKYSTVYGWTFDKELGDKQSIILNLSGEAQVININQLQPANAYEQISCKNPMYFVTGKVWWPAPYNNFYNSVEHDFTNQSNAPANFDSVNIKIPSGTNVIYLPPYSITRLYVLNNSSVWLRASDTKVCAADNLSADTSHASTAVNLYASGGAYYEWTNSNQITNSQSSVATSPLTSFSNGSLKVFDNEGNLLGTKSDITVNVTSLPSVTVTPTSFSNTNFSATFLAVAKGADKYNWNPTSGLSNILSDSVSISPGSTTTYQVIGIGTDGCAKIQKISATVAPSISIKSSSGIKKNSFSPPTLSVCNGEEITLYADGVADAYEWSSVDGTISGTEPSITFVADHQVLINLKSTDNVKQRTSTTRILLNTTPDIGVRLGSQFGCANSLLIIRASLNGINSSFSWNDGIVGSHFYSSQDTTIVEEDVMDTDNDQLFFNAPAGNYSLNVIGKDPDDDQCPGIENSESIDVMLSDSTVVLPATSSACIIKGGTVTLTASGDGDDYTWNGPHLNKSVGNSVEASPVATSNYSVTTSNSQCCVTATTTVTVIVFDAACDGSIYCYGCNSKDASVQPYDPFNYYYQWYENNVVVAGATNGTYSITRPDSITLKEVTIYCTVSKIDNSCSPGRTNDVRVTLKSGCNYAREQNDIYINEEKPVISIFPNPSSKDFTIQFNQKNLKDKNVLMQVYDVFGTIQLTQLIELENGAFTKYVHHSMAEGIYLLRICSSAGCTEKNILVVN